MVLRIALLLTGELRTFERTQKILYDHLIAPNQVEVFIHAEKTSYHEKIDGIEDDAMSYFSKYWNGSVKSAQFMNECNKTEYESYILPYILNTKPGLNEKFFTKSGVSKSFLWNSGTIIEYYQIWKCSQLMTEYERTNEFQYDVIIRGRLDMIFTIPVKIREFFEVSENFFERFHNWCLNSDHKNLFEKEDLKLDLVSIWVQCLGIEYVATQQLEEILKCESPDCQHYIKKSKNGNEDFIDSIRNKNFIHSFRKNVFWVGKRRDALPICQLIFNYGDFVEEGNNWAWNSETQFDLLLEHWNIMHFDFYDSVLEEYLTSKSLNTNVIIEEEGNVKINDKDIMRGLIFTVIRPLDYSNFRYP